MNSIIEFIQNFLRQEYDTLIISAGDDTGLFRKQIKSMFMDSG